MRKVRAFLLLRCDRSYGAEDVVRREERSGVEGMRANVGRYIAVNLLHVPRRTLMVPRSMLKPMEGEKILLIFLVARPPRPVHTKEFRSMGCRLLAA